MKGQYVIIDIRDMDFIISQKEHPLHLGLCVVALSKNLKLTTALDRAITQVFTDLKH